MGMCVADITWSPTMYINASSVCLRVCVAVAETTGYLLMSGR